MLRKIFLLIFSLGFAVFAQGTYEPSEVNETSYYESNSNVAQENTSSYDSQEQTYQPLQIKYDEINPNDIGKGSEPNLYIGIHPITLLIFTAAGIPTVYLTFENTFLNNSSFLVRPLFMYFDNTIDDVNVSILEFGITGGFRYYLNKQHKGLFTEGEIQIAYANVKGSDSYDHVKGSAFVIGPYFLIGRKWTFGSMALSIDIGIGINYMYISYDSSNEDLNDDVEDAVGSVFGYDANFIWSFGI